MENFLVAEIELTYKSKVKAKDRVSISNSQTAYDVFLPFFEEKMEFKEVAYAMYLNTSNKVLGVLKISEGMLNACMIDARNVLQGALKLNAANIIIAHNHPSGNLEPSRPDIELTRKLVDAAKLMNFKLLDSMIITNEGYHSMEDKGDVLFC